MRGVLGQVSVSAPNVVLRSERPGKADDLRGKGWLRALLVRVACCACRLSHWSDEPWPKMEIWKYRDPPVEDGRMMQQQRRRRGAQIASQGLRMGFEKSVSDGKGGKSRLHCLHLWGLGNNRALGALPFFSFSICI